MKTLLFIVSVLSGWTPGAAAAPISQGNLKSVWQVQNAPEFHRALDAGIGFAASSTFSVDQ